MLWLPDGVEVAAGFALAGGGAGGDAGGRGGLVVGGSDVV